MGFYFLKALRVLYLFLVVIHFTIMFPTEDSYHLFFGIFVSLLKLSPWSFFFFLISETFSKSFLQIFPPLYWSFSFPSEIPMIWFLARNTTFFFVFTIYLCLSFLQSTLFWYFNLLACSFYPFYSQSLFHLFF